MFRASGDFRRPGGDHVGGERSRQDRAHGGEGAARSHDDGGEGSFYRATPSGDETTRDGEGETNGGRRGEEHDGGPQVFGRRAPSSFPTAVGREREEMDEVRRRADEWRRANIPPEWGKQRDLGLANPIEGV
ncbi:unnamed protein product [Urochloa humidicola]